MTTFKPGDRVREIIREEILYRLKGAESHARACASDHGVTCLASQADKAADVLTARLASFTDVLEPAGRPSREDVAGAIWTAENLDRAVLADCWEIAGRVLDLYPEPVPDLPVIAYEDIKPGMVVEKRERRRATRGEVHKGVRLEYTLDAVEYRLVPAPEPDPDAELVTAIRAASASIDGHDPLPGLPEARDLLEALQADGWTLVQAGESK